MAAVSKRLGFILLIACLVVHALLAPIAVASPLTDAETSYADLNDANGIVGAIDSGLFTSYRGRNRAAWNDEFQAKRAALATQLAAIDAGALSKSDARVHEILRAKLKSFVAEPASEGSQHGRCADARNREFSAAALSSALVGCFTEIANNLEFEGRRIDRASALTQLHELDDPARRKALFYAFQPLWQAVNGKDEPDSPYRRLIAQAAADMKSAGSPIDAAARTVGVTSGELEQWLVRILETWCSVTSGETLEPWDYRYAAGAAGRDVAPKIARLSLLELDHRFYRDLGVDLEKLGVLYDLEPRPDKSSVAYTDFLIHGRKVAGTWQPTIARVLASYRSSNLGSLSELVHENGHALHISAIRNRPVYVDWNDDLFVEAFADVPSWSVYEPAWQRHYLGASAPERDSLRALYGSVMLDVAWALFEARMLHDPQADPNSVWTEITHRYLHIIPHPELSWWAVRVQLVDLPGYMVNYGLGSVVTADIRERVRQQIGPFDTGNPRWYPWLTDNLLRFGSERDTPTLLKTFLGRPVSADALLAQIRRLAPVPTQACAR
jgi:hypothetical protein